ncbi:MAG TPA: 23S rRNA (pseudouridine(1915)-N(3))-methyltransferase RlmH [Bauldia sp.]|nr:23S rRNA (pseudouridine(1915)-N(3))-methyltransferase RlmH [Bauldia sp.]
MLITIAAVGKLKAGPERDLYDRYVERATGAGRSLALTFATREFVESRAAAATTRKEQEAETLLALGGTLVALDEGGRTLDSRSFADRIARWRDDGVAGLVFALGGPDGHGDALLKKSALRLAFGPMTWPHQLARIMLAEQLYRAVTILSGHPYHRD